VSEIDTGGSAAQLNKFHWKNQWRNRKKSDQLKNSTLIKEQLKVWDSLKWLG
jgi:hypothetical protein